jgi:hypothetical protein
MPDVHVPTVAELEHLGLAHRDTGGQKGQVARVFVTDEGHRLMGEAMRANAQRSSLERTPAPPGVEHTESSTP